MSDLQKLQDDIYKWDRDTFGKFRSSTPIAIHLRKEADELITALNVFHEGTYSGVMEYHAKHKRIKMEAVDCFILLLDVLAHEQFRVVDLYEGAVEKHEINKTRTWGLPDENGVIEHVHEAAPENNAFEGITEAQFFNSLKNEAIAFFLNDFVKKNPNDADLGKAIRNAVQHEKIFQL